MGIFYCCRKKKSTINNEMLDTEFQLINKNNNLTKQILDKKKNSTIFI